MAESIKLKGLSGDNPQHFLAALGVVTALDARGADVQMWWENNTLLNPVISSAFSYKDIADAAKRLASEWIQGSRLLADDLTTKGQQLKFPHDKVRELMSQARETEGGDRFLYSCISEGARPEGDKTVSKPSALCFTSGTEYFAKHAQNILTYVTSNDIRESLTSPNAYKDLGGGMTMRWNALDSAQYALAARDPSGEKKLTNPGAELLSILGFSCIPCFTANGRTRTQGVKPRQPGKSEYKGAQFCWPLWKRPMRLTAIRTIVAHSHSTDPGRYTSCGISKLFAADIGDLPQGRKSFRFSHVVWDSESP